MRENFTRIMYLTSFSSIIASIIYFFASNWSGFSRFEKIGLSVCLLLLFYLFGFVVSKKIENHPFLGKWFIFTGSLTFGVTVGLLGQIYNSHADSYMLFLIWFIPTILFAIVTKYQPFYVTSFLLLNLTVWFYTHPSQGFFSRTNEEQFLVLLMFAFVNLVIFIISYKKIIPSPIVKGLSFSFSNFILIVSTFNFIFGNKGFLLNFIYAPLLLASIYYLSKKTNEKLLTVLSGIALSFYAIVKYFELAIELNELFYLGGMIFAGLLIFGTIKMAKIISNMDDTQTRSRLFLKDCLLVFATVIASFIGSASTLGFIFLLSDNIAPYIAYFVAIIGFIGYPLRIKKWDPAVSYTLLSIGFLMASGVSLTMHPFFGVLLLGVIIYSWVTTETTGLKYLLYLIANGLIFYLSFRHLIGRFSLEINDIALILIVMTLINLIVYLLRDKIDQVAAKNSLIYALLPLLALTFIGDVGDKNYIVYNTAFFVLTLVVLIRSKTKAYLFEYRVASVFWFLFLLLKYYDFGWKLLHKSIALFIIGGILFTVAFLLDKNSVYPKQQTNFLMTKQKWITAIIVLQLLITGGQIGKSELLLSQGEMIKLKLQPVDPRSLMQGDYVILNYEISNIEIDFGNDQKGKIEVLLRENQDGIYEYSGIYKFKELGWNKPYTAQEGDIIIAGKYTGFNRIVYGIENFFIEEGTGSEVERNMEYAYVKVAKNGDAILESISK